MADFVEELYLYVDINVSFYGEQNTMFVNFIFFLLIYVKNTN